MKLISSTIHLVTLILPSFFILSSSRSSAQDTAHQVIMSQSAYDSTLKALKKAHATERDSSASITNDTAKTRDSTIINLMRSIAALKKIDSLLKVMIRMDSLAKADSAAMKAKQDSVARWAAMPDTTKKPRRECYGYIAVNGGIGLPVSDYANIQSAAAGRNFSLCAEFPGITSKYCWTFKFDYGINGINIPQYIHDVSEYTSSQLQFSMNFPIPSYSYYSLMTGISRIFPINRLTFDARLLIGFLQATAPQTSYTINDSGSTLTVTRYKCSAWAFTFGFGIDARYRITSGFSVLLNFDYLNAYPTMNVATTGLNQYPFAPTPAINKSVTEAFVLNNVTLGIGYTIASKSKSSAY